MSTPGRSTSDTTGPALVAVTSTGQVSGAERVLLRTLAAAVEAGWTVTCLCPDGALSEQLVETGATHVSIPELNLAAGPKPVAVLRTMARWWRAARALRTASRTADVVLANALLSLPAVRLARPARTTGRRVPTVWLAHDVVVSAGRLRLYRRCSTALTAVIGVSEAVIARLRTADGTGPALQVVHNGVTFPVDPAVGPSDGPAVVGLNGLLTPWKGQSVLLDAVALVEVPVRVELLGGTLAKDADYAAALRLEVEILGLGDRVDILGHHLDPLARMRTWTLAVSASTDPEACPLAVLEAMSIGLPVIATDHGGSPEVLDGAGILVAPRDAPALARAITEMVLDPSLQSTRSRRGLERISSAHRLDVQTTRLLEALKGLTREMGTG